MQSKINQELDTNLLLELQEKINTDATMRYLNLSHREIGKLSLANFRKFCKMVSILGCLYAIDLSGNNLCDLTPIQHTVLLDSLRKLPYLSRINLSENNLLLLNKLWLNEYMTLIAGEKCAASLKVNNTDFAVSILEVEIGRVKKTYKDKNPEKGESESNDGTGKSGDDKPEKNAEDGKSSDGKTQKDKTEVIKWWQETKLKPLRLENFTLSLSSNLTELSLSQTNLSRVALTIAACGKPAAWKTLCEGLAKLEHLRVIDLSSNQLSDVALEQRNQLWENLKKCKKLWYVNLQDNGFDHHDIEILKQTFKPKNEDKPEKNKADDEGEGKGHDHDLFCVILDDGLYEFKPRGRHFFEMSASLIQKMDHADFLNTIRILSQIAIMFPQKQEVRDLRDQLSEFDSKITLSASERSGLNLPGLFFNEQRLSQYKKLDALYDAPSDSPRILHAKTELRYKKSLAEQDANISFFCDQFQRTFDSLTCKLNLAAEGEFTKNYVHIGLEGIETAAELATHIIHEFKESASDILKGFALFLPAVSFISFGYECNHVYNVGKDAKTFMAFVKTPQRATALGQVLAYNLCFQMQDQLRALDCANKISVISKLARQCVKNMIQLMVSDATPANLDILLLGEKLCSRYMISCPSKAKELSQQTLDSFVEQEIKKRTP